MSLRRYQLLALPILFVCGVLHAGPPDQILNEPVDETLSELIINQPPPYVDPGGVAKPGLPLSNRWRSFHRLAKMNRKLQGEVLDFTRNHGSDRRIFSAALNQPRDMYVYLPPCYDPNIAYPLVIWLHGAFGDESAFLLCCQLETLDDLIVSGEIPPMIVACPDGTYGGTGGLTEQHSFYINGMGGPYEDYLILDVLPFLFESFSIRPEREAHGLGGVSAGGFGALSLAMKHRELFGACAVLAGPINMRYASSTGRYFANFRPQTYQWRTEYNPRQVAGKYFVVLKLRAQRLISGVFGPPESLLENVMANNPADLLYTTGIQPGDLAIYINYPGHDNFNFDAHAESFIWLANQQGIYPDVKRVGWARHWGGYFRRNHDDAYRWLGSHLLPPAPIEQDSVEAPSRQPPLQSVP